MAFDFDLLKEQLVCPLSHAALVLEESSLVSCDPEKRLRYEIRDDIPIMLVDEAEEVPAEEWASIMERNGRDPQTGQPGS